MLNNIIKFELRGLSPLVLQYTSKTGYFQDKNLQGISSSELLFSSKMFAGGNVPCFPPTGPSYLENLTQKCKTLNVFWA